ncbi:MAG: thioredoxin family protein [Saprospiraceae bacterium]|nr:thioredoxin family protein [Pyrinomonadaceae bacterium]
MKRKSTAYFIVLALIAFGFISNNGKASDFAIGTTLEDFSLPDTAGKTHSFNDLKGKNGAVIIFLSAQCPVVKGYNERINQIAADYAAKGITFVGINSNSTESLERVKSHAAENYKFPMLIDKGNIIADKLGAMVTPEAYYFDSKNKLIYHGAIDNSRNGDNISSNYLRTAFDTSMSGKPVKETRINAFGCSIKRAGE